MQLTPKRDIRILDLDVECRPMAWYGGDWVTKEITAIAWRFTDESESQTRCWLLTPSRTWAEHMSKRRRGMQAFLRDYNEADMVTGHFIRGFDLPLINATCMRLGLPPLPAKDAHDTKNDLIRMSGLSKSQENLAAYFDLKVEKQKMNAHLWEVGNSLVEEGRRETERRVVGDIQQHIAFREELIARHALMPAKEWSCGASAERYHP